MVRGRLLESSEKGGAVTFSGYRVGAIDFRDVEGGDMTDDEDEEEAGDSVEENIESVLTVFIMKLKSALT